MGDHAQALWRILIARDLWPVWTAREHVEEMVADLEGSAVARLGVVQHCVAQPRVEAVHP